MLTNEGNYQREAFDASLCFLMLKKTLGRKEKEKTEQKSVPEVMTRMHIF